MKPPRVKRQLLRLVLLTLLASSGLGCSAGATLPKTELLSKNETPKTAKRLPKETVDAWRAARAQIGLIEVNDTGHIRFQAEEVLKLPNDKQPELTAQQVPAFHFTISGKDQKAINQVAKLPVPPMPFGLSLTFPGAREGWLKELAVMKNLQALDLRGSTVADSDLEDVARFENLQTLVLTSSEITDARLEDLAALKNLRALNLVNANVTDVAPKKLAALKNLEVLFIHGGSVTDAGLKELPRLANLRILFLSGPRITDAGLQDLAAMKNLRTLILVDTKVTKTGVDKLKNALPECEVHQ